jgi:hypothetical protein
LVRAIPEEPREYYDPDDFNSQVREYVRLKETVDALDKRSKELREKLMAVIDDDGLPDANGNILYEFDTPIDGVLRLEKQRRATRKLDEEKAEEIIEAAGIADDVYKMVRVIDEDALMASFYEGKITEEQIDEMFPTTVVWALRTPKK